MKNASTFNVLRQRRSRNKMISLKEGEAEEEDVAEALGGIVEANTPKVWPLHAKEGRKRREEANLYKRTGDARTKTKMVFFILVVALAVMASIFHAGWKIFVGKK